MDLPRNYIDREGPGDGVVSSPSMDLAPLFREKRVLLVLETIFLSAALPETRVRAKGVA